MSKQDRHGVRTPTDIERKYDLASIPGMKKAIKNAETGVNKTNATLEEFMAITLGKFENMQNQIDGNITTYFYSGEPTLENQPANEWLTDEEKNNHLGDLYYDQETGAAYRFVCNEGEFSWLKLDDSDVAEALAIANAAKDTADGKRRVFTDTPYPPYDNGDLWFNNQEIYICQISKDSDGVYEENDFIVATKYTDDTIANKVGDELEIIKGTVTTIKENVDSVKIEIETTVKTVDELKQETMESIEKMSYAFGTQDFKVEKTGTEMNTRISENGMKVYKGDDPTLIADGEGVKAKNLHANTYLTVGKNSRLEDYKVNRTALFYIGGGN